MPISPLKPVDNTDKLKKQISGLKDDEQGTYNLKMEDQKNKNFFDKQMQRLDELIDDEISFVIDKKQVEYLINVMTLKVAEEKDVDKKQELQIILEAAKLTRGENEFLIAKQQFIPLTRQEANYLEKLYSQINNIDSKQLEQRTADIDQIQEITEEIQTDKKMTNEEKKFLNTLCDSLSKEIEVTH